MSSIDSITFTPLEGTNAVPAPDSEGELTPPSAELLPLALSVVLRDGSAVEVAGRSGSSEPAEVVAEEDDDVDDVVEEGSRSSCSD